MCYTISVRINYERSQSIYDKNMEVKNMAEPLSNPFGIIKLKELAKYLSVPESTVRTWKRRGNLPQNCFICIGGTVYAKVNEVQNWIDKQAA